MSSGTNCRKSKRKQEEVNQIINNKKKNSKN